MRPRLAPNGRLRGQTVLAVLLLATGTIAGCLGPGPDGTPTATATSTGTTQPPAPAFDGAAALSLVRGLALNPAGEPRYRIPGSPGQLEGAAYLWKASEVSGWERHFENFTGADYRGLDRSTVAAYGPGSAYCPAAWEERLDGLRFANLVVTRRAADPAAPTLVLGAHWDSQPESNYDPNPANRSKPDPGANDGASGVGVLLQLMRELGPAAPPVTVRILFIDGEDGFFACYPIAGSLHHVQRGNRTGEAGFILLDMVGDPGARFPREGSSVASALELVDLLWAHGQTLAAPHFTNETATISDDHLAYAQASIPAVDVIDYAHGRGFPDQWDTTFDTVDRLDPGTLGKVGAVLLAAVSDPHLAAALA